MYIILEGIDGAGKSTQTKLLKKWLKDNGLSTVSIVEPTDSEIGKLIRKLLKNPDATTLDFQKMLGLLFAADRLLLMKQIEQYEAEGKIVISDRSFYSSLAYQEPATWIMEINKFAKKPDILLLLDLDTKTAVSRCSDGDEFEKEPFLKEVKNKYLELAKKEDDIFTIIDANKGKKLVQKDIRKKIAPLLDICTDGII